ncbi:hypothetical protein SS50377_21164 [Spironucleus salmonicida]|uniref:Uncharacterized protein n=1 Tax=Spironucleus salmonicida TaxID=348837 RepID=V6LHA4_9EUKA|nr:hypothetical protein SS50377_21164 [Spironucleus salmonicida]|eukprot:EST43945.1 Hypothetical protein SS50377_16247 [Spironucleus salmonicida]
MIDDLSYEYETFLSAVTKIIGKDALNNLMQSSQLKAKIQYSITQETLFYEQLKKLQTKFDNQQVQLDSANSINLFLKQKIQQYQNRLLDDIYDPIRQLKEKNQIIKLSIPEQDHLVYIKKIHILNQTVFQLKSNILAIEQEKTQLKSDYQLLKLKLQVSNKNDYTALTERIKLLEQQTEFYARIIDVKSKDFTLAEFAHVFEENTQLRSQISILQQQLAETQSSITTDQKQVIEENNFLQNQIYELQFQITRNQSIYKETAYELRQQIKQLENPITASMDPEFEPCSPQILASMSKQQICQLENNSSFGNVEDILQIKQPLFQFQAINDIELLTTEQILNQQ